MTILCIVVPRTFFGACILSYVAKLIAFIIPKRAFDLASHPMLVQFLIRLELLLLNWFTCIRLASAVDSFFHRKSDGQNDKKSTIHHSKSIGGYYLLITAVQFHIPFYSSRLLPNTFALLLITNAYADWCFGYYRRTAIYLVFTTAIFRCDMMMLLFTVGLCMLIRRQLTIVQAISIGVKTGIFSLLITVPLDSLLWGRLIWPEFEVWWFNAIDNRSSEWGEMIWHWYFSRALPKGLMATVVVIPFAFLRLPDIIEKSVTEKYNVKKRTQSDLFDWTLFHFLAPVFAFVVLYSFLPHKEIRFIFPVIPMFNICSAYGMSKLHLAAFPNTTNEHKKSNWAAKLMFLFGIGSIVITFVGSSIFLRLSAKNYPGGEALLTLRSHLLDTIPHQSADGKSQWNDVHVHVDVAAAMTGVSLFGQRHASIRRVGEGNDNEGPFIINKSGYEDENKLADDNEMKSYTHLITERPLVDGYHLIETIKGYPRLDIKHARITTSDAIFVHEKDDWIY